MSNRLLSPLKAIRANCLDCSGGSQGEVDKCVIPDCPLFPYRFGKRPETAKKRGKEMADWQREKKIKEPTKGKMPSGLRKFLDAKQGTKQIDKIGSVEENRA
ncbi:unnamed protein product [marine sediment metagenome]|uniref:Uncharacterized protein n=1 Tax=marine sediment metagenome TaxID=412755 RepID=X0ZMR7_9ZZZZ